ncbi:radical SAM protein [Myxococcota bacterium]|nr:radical SAM protein [Myxococcota bacterium]MCZ7619398.1 radical SAM protein [Myxococcota bacterium]
MRYEGRVFRPPSEHDAYILQATIGCSHNHCTYCDMYRDKRFRVRELGASLEDLQLATRAAGSRIEKLFVADGDALVLPLDHWLPILAGAREGFPRLRRISCYATARNVLDKSDAELAQLRAGGLTRLYLGPESGDDVVLRRIAKGGSAADHIEAARRAHAAGFETSVIVLLGAGGLERSQEHAQHTAALVTAMDPAYFAALTLTVVPGTPIARLAETGRFELPDVAGLLGELRTIIDCARPTDAVFRTNHASNYLPLGGRLPADRVRILRTLDAALAGAIPLRPESARGL